jgi:hypothetical protein
VDETPGDDAYAAPKARIEEAPHARGSLLRGFVLGWLAIAGALLVVVLIARYVRPGDVPPEARTAMVWFFIALPPVAVAALGAWFLWRKRQDSAAGAFAALALAVAGLVALALWIVRT